MNRGEDQVDKTVDDHPFPFAGQLAAMGVARMIIKMPSAMKKDGQHQVSVARPEAGSTTGRCQRSQPRSPTAAPSPNPGARPRSQRGNEGDRTGDEETAIPEDRGREAGKRRNDDRGEAQKTEDDSFARNRPQ